MVSKKIIAVVIVIAVLAVGVGIWANGSASTDDSLNGQEVNLAAAASLKNVFDEKLIPMFEEKYPGVKVTPTYASSGDLQKQIEILARLEHFCLPGLLPQLLWIQV